MSLTTYGVTAKRKMVDDASLQMRDFLRAVGKVVAGQLQGSHLISLVLGPELTLVEGVSPAAHCSQASGRLGTSRECRDVHSGSGCPSCLCPSEHLSASVPGGQACCALVPSWPSLES